MFDSYEVTRLAAQMQFRFPQFPPTPLSQLIPNASPEALNLIQVILSFIIVFFFVIYHWLGSASVRPATPSYCFPNSPISFLSSKVASSSILLLLYPQFR